MQQCQICCNPAYRNMILRRVVAILKGRANKVILSRRVISMVLIIYWRCMVARWSRIIITRLLWGLAGIHALVPFPSMPRSRIVNKTTAMCLTGKVIKLPTTNLWAKRRRVLVWRPGVIHRVITGHLMITFGQTIKIIIAVMKTMSMTLPIITRTILAVKIASLPIWASHCQKAGGLCP